MKAAAIKQILFSLVFYSVGTEASGIDSLANSKEVPSSQSGNSIILSLSRKNNAIGSGDNMQDFTGRLLKIIPKVNDEIKIASYRYSNEEFFTESNFTSRLKEFHVALKKFDKGFFKNLHDSVYKINSIQKTVAPHFETTFIIGSDHASDIQISEEVVKIFKQLDLIDDLLLTFYSWLDSFGNEINEIINVSDSIHKSLKVTIESLETNCPDENKPLSFDENQLVYFFKLDFFRKIILQLFDIISHVKFSDVIGDSLKEQQQASYRNWEEEIKTGDSHSLEQIEIGNLFNILSHRINILTGFKNYLDFYKSRFVFVFKCGEFSIREYARLLEPYRNIKIE